MKENKFLIKFKEKTATELLEIANDKKGYQPEARQAAIQILNERGHTYDFEVTEVENKKGLKEYDFTKFEASIKKEHSFGWTPKFEKSFNSELSKTTFIPIVSEVFEKLDWPMVLKEENLIIAAYFNNWGKETEKIEVQFSHGKISVKSSSLSGSFWDMGKNSKRVKLFIHAFQRIMQEYDRDSLNELEIETEKVNNWDDYEIPKTLPRPKKRKKPNVFIPIIGGVFSSLLLGVIIAFLSVDGLYFLFLFEVGVAFILGFIFSELIKLSNYTNYRTLHIVFIVTVLIVYISNQYFQYQIVLYRNDGIPFSFIKFLEFRIEAGLAIKNLELGPIGLILSWIAQLVITYFIGILRLGLALSAYQIERIPGEVIEFVMYHFVKGKSEQEVRYELGKMGWQNKEHQDEVLASLESMNDLQAYNRIT